MKRAESDLTRIRASVLAFFDAEARELPWRREADPYRIWISEVMLQQTRVETVIGYYRRWLERFPEVETLAAAEIEEVLQLWKGLGYYSRARNLRDAARVVRERHDGRLPESVEELRTLPGVGEYTAGAVASIAFGVSTPAVDGNVRRVLARLFDLPDPTPAHLRERAGALVDPERPGDFNQALMELGATVCTPRAPRCVVCPLADDCRARAAGTVSERPRPRRRVKAREIEIGVAVVRRGRWILLRRRPEDGLLPGLWEFPGATVKVVEDAETAARRAAHECGIAPEGAARPLPEVRHLFSHLKATYRPFVFDLPGSAPRVRPGAGLKDRKLEHAPTIRWLETAELDTIPLSRAQQRIQALLDPAREPDAGSDSADGSRPESQVPAKGSKP